MHRPLALQLLDEPLAVVRLPPGAGLPWWAASSPGFLSLTRTGGETSIVCEAGRVPTEVRAERGFRALRVEGTLSFGETGVLMSLAVPLAAAGVPIFVISTFDTDYLLIPAPLVTGALEALKRAGHSVAE